MRKPLRVLCLIQPTEEASTAAASTLAWVLRRYDSLQVEFSADRIGRGSDVLITNVSSVSAQGTKGLIQILQMPSPSARRNLIVLPGVPRHPLWEGLQPFQVTDALPGETSLPAQAQVIARTPEGVPLAWVTSRDQQNVFATRLGQTALCWQHPLYQKMLVNAVYWCAQRTPPPLLPVRAPKGFVPLFNGVNLEGWGEVGSPCWTVQDGVIQCSGAGSGGWLRTNRMYRDFVLLLEYRISPGGNSGIFLRAPHFGRSSRLGIELQILDDQGQPPTATSTAAVYSAVPPRMNPSKPAGEWNQVRITFRGRRLHVVWNGQVVQDIDLDDPALNAPLPRTHLLTRRPSHGYIGLQNHRSLVEFRNLFLCEL